MRYRKIFLILAIMGFAVTSFAQAGKKTKKACQKDDQTQKLEMPALQAKKAGVRRTLKEKNFHLPDTTHRNR